jgi:spermidine/putrescine transport system ATP-binding protein
MLTGAAERPGSNPGVDSPGPDQVAPAIELVGVTKQFGVKEGNVQAVNGIDLSIGQGEFFSLLGPSGCGKSTTLRMIAGLEEPDGGDILLKGASTTGVPPNRRDVNMVFQDYALFPHMTVFNNIAYGLRRRNVPSAEVTRRVNEILELVELGGLGTRRSRDLSGGQQQRVALARALVNRPGALLLDEPLGALDLKLRQAMQTELKRIQRDVGITFVYVTHDQTEALVMSDRLAIMNAGRVEQLGTPHDVYEYPATRFVAGFVGVSNILTGDISQLVDGIGVINFGAGGRVLVAQNDNVAKDSPVYLTVRPEKISISSDSEPPEADCRLRGRVREVIYLGTSTSYAVTTVSGDEIVVHLLNSASSNERIARDTDVWLHWSTQHSYAIGA